MVRCGGGDCEGIERWHLWLEKMFEVAVVLPETFIEQNFWLWTF